MGEVMDEIRDVAQIARHIERADHDAQQRQKRCGGHQNIEQELLCVFGLGRGLRLRHRLRLRRCGLRLWLRLGHGRLLRSRCAADHAEGRAGGQKAGAAAASPGRGACRVGRKRLSAETAEFRAVLSCISAGWAERHNTHLLSFQNSPILYQLMCEESNSRSGRTSESSTSSCG